jgi:translation initiation factor 3 subunit L
MSEQAGNEKAEQIVDAEGDDSTETEDEEEQVEVVTEQIAVQSEQQKERVKIPSEVEKFISQLARAIKNQNVGELEPLYFSQYGRLSERYFSNSAWPEYESLKHIALSNNESFELLYRELFYRHLLKQAQPSVSHWVGSWRNYCALFEHLLNAAKPRQLDIPDHWLWDIVDEFIYQYQAFCQTCSNLKNKSQEEIEQLKANAGAWNSAQLLGYLQAIVEKSAIVSTLARESRAGENNGENGEANRAELAFDEHPAYRRLGFFSLIALLRVNSLFGDYHAALSIADSLDINKKKKKAYSAKVPLSYITLCYYTGFALMMTQRYSEAMKTFATVLSFINRLLGRSTQQYEQMKKKSDQTYALLAITLCLHPGRIDETIHNALKEKHGEKMAKMQRGEWLHYEELFSFGCPKFISPAQASFDEPQSNTRQEPLRFQLRVFMAEVKQQAILPTIRSYLKLYSSIPLAKLAELLQVDQQTLLSQLMFFKHLTTANAATGSHNAGHIADVSFHIDGDMVHISEVKSERRYGEYFLHHIHKLQRSAASTN